MRVHQHKYNPTTLSKETEAELLAGEEAAAQEADLSLLAQQQSEFELKADLYFAYANVHAFVTDPFTR
jgi:hypothetical protein